MLPSKAAALQAKAAGEVAEGVKGLALRLDRIEAALAEIRELLAKPAGPAPRPSFNEAVRDKESRAK